MGKPNLKIFALGYSDNTSTAYILRNLSQRGVRIDGAIFPKNHFTRSAKRVLKKFQLRGFFPTLSRIAENLFTNRQQIQRACRQHIDRIFWVDRINSEEVRAILINNQVDVLLLTATPIIKSILIDIDGLTILNAHTGWLPTYRGLDANLKALRDGHKPGVSIHKVTEKIDAGEIYLRRTFDVDFGKDILKQLDEGELLLAEQLFFEAINLKLEKKLEPIKTSEPLAKYFPPLSKKEKERVIRDLQYRHGKLNPDFNSTKEPA